MKTAMLTVHLLGAVVWVGGLTLVSWALLPACRGGKDETLLVGALQRFQWVARACSALMLLSGGFLIGKLYPASTWFSTRSGGAALAMMVLWLVLTVVGELTARPRQALAQDPAQLSRLSAYYHLAAGVGLLLILDAAVGLAR